MHYPLHILIKTRKAHLTTLNFILLQATTFSYVTSYYTHIFGQNQLTLYGWCLLYGILVFLREAITHMLYIPIIKQIQEGCFEIRFQVFIIFFNWCYVMKLIVKLGINLKKFI